MMTNMVESFQFKKILFLYLYGSLETIVAFQWMSEASIYIGIKFNFVLCELDVRWTLSFHNDLP